MSASCGSRALTNMLSYLLPLAGAGLVWFAVKNLTSSEPNMTLVLVEVALMTACFLGGWCCDLMLKGPRDEKVTSQGTVLMISAAAIAAFASAICIVIGAGMEPFNYIIGSIPFVGALTALVAVAVYRRFKPLTPNVTQTS